MICIMRRILLFFLIASLFSCEKEISEKQADYFTKFYGTFLNDYSSDLKELSDGGYVILGTSEVADKGTQMSFFKTDKYGRQLGETLYYGTDGEDNGNGLLALSDGFLISGSSTNLNGTLDAALVKIDFSGNQSMEMIRETSSNDEAYAAIPKDEGGYFFVGYTESNRLYIVSYDDNFENPQVSGNEAGIRIKLKKICRFGDNQYFSVGTRIIDESTNKSQISVLLINEDGNYVVAGDFGSPEDRNDFSSIVQQNDSTLFVLSTYSVGGSNTTKLKLLKLVYKIDNLNPGKLLYMVEKSSKIYSDAGILEANSLAIREDGSMIMLATKTFAGDKNILLYQLDKEGEQIGSAKEFGGSGDQTGSSLLYSNGSIVILGSNSFDGNSMITLIKTDDQGNLWD